MSIPKKNRTNQAKATLLAVLMICVLLLVGSGNVIGSLMIKNDSKIESVNVIGQIERVALMPNLPEPFNMRDWEQVTRDYDTLFFNLGATGTFLPLTSIGTNHWGIEGDRDVFRAPSYIGLPMADEAINLMAAVLSATLVGIDKSSQSGYNWVEMCENWYNIDTNQYIYLNNLQTTAKTSFWYVLFPNLIFYMLADYYPDVGDFENQMRGVADRWYDACVGMGGKISPWTVPNFLHTAFDFNSMTPYDNNKWREPDAAGAIAWLEYMAYLKFGDPKYLIAAEWCVEYLHTLSFNPYYEVLMLYGALITARMNAELGRAYNINKMIDWCFGTGNGGVRSGWGVIADQWGGFDAYGLSGSITDGGGYGFTMNTFETVGALMPVVRYDDRFAHDIGKFVLNAANAARLHYGTDLDAAHQDSEDWKDVYDPNNSVAYESLRKTWNGITPLATGDLNRDRYADQTGATNLGLYGSSHVGNLGGIIAPTNDEKILQLDCLVTDYYHEEAYPTYLYFNPYAISKTIEIDVGTENKSLYETTSESFLVTNATGVTSFEIPADTAFVVVITPADGNLTYDGTRTLINNVTVDYEPVEPVTTTTTLTTSTTTITTTSTKASPFSSILLVSLALSTVIFFLRRKRKN
ncbi:hypothetical protein CEE45_04215 [Candidatus Heimdallarchaeota archaeon B3_Heim]|nr:MAG: hypothetical protein CEE45_04215 [Candidatus Heimdallarchaeota archaeon B3_Heim]